MADFVFIGRCESCLMSWKSTVGGPITVLPEFFRPKRAIRSISQGHRPWFRSPLKFAGLKGRPFDSVAAFDGHFLNGRPFRPSITFWLNNQGRWPWLFELLTLWAGRLDCESCREPLIRSPQISRDFEKRSKSHDPYETRHHAPSQPIQATIRSRHGLLMCRSTASKTVSTDRSRMHRWCFKGHSRC